MLQKADLRPIAIDVPAAALARRFTGDGQATSNSTPRLIVHVADSVTPFVVAARGECWFASTVAFGAELRLEMNRFD